VYVVVAVISGEEGGGNTLCWRVAGLVFRSDRDSFKREEMKYATNTDWIIVIPQCSRDI